MKINKTKSISFVKMYLKALWNEFFKENTNLKQTSYIFKISSKYKKLLFFWNFDFFHLEETKI